MMLRLYDKVRYTGKYSLIPDVSRGEITFVFLHNPDLFEVTFENMSGKNKFVVWRDELIRVS